MKVLKLDGVGGLGFTQDDLDFMQQAYTEIATAFITLGAPSSPIYPVILSGMELSGAVLSAGWFAVFGKVYYCAGGDLGTLPGPGYEFVVSLTETAIQRPYRSGGPLRDVRLNKVGTFRTIATADIISDEDFPIGSFEQFGQRLGARNRLETGAYSLISVGAADVDADIIYIKDIIANTVYLRFNLNINDAQSLDPALSATFYDLGELPDGFMPVDTQFFTAHKASAGMMRDFDGYGLLKQFTGKVGSDGSLAIELIKPDASIAGYSVAGTCVFNLD